MRKVKVLVFGVVALSGVLTVGAVQKGKAEGMILGISFYQHPKACKELFIKAAENAAKDTQAKIAAARLDGKEPSAIALDIKNRSNMDIMIGTECLRLAITSIENLEIGAINEGHEWALTMIMVGLVRSLVVEEYFMLHGAFSREDRASVEKAKRKREENVAKVGEFGGLTGEEIMAIAREAITSYGVIIR